MVSALSKRAWNTLTKLVKRFNDLPQVVPYLAPINIRLTNVSRLNKNVPRGNRITQKKGRSGIVFVSLFTFRPQKVFHLPWT